MEYLLAIAFVVIVAVAFVLFRRTSPTTFDPPQGIWEILTMDKGDGPQDRRPLMLVWNSSELFLLAPTGETKAMGRIARLDKTKNPAEIDLQFEGAVGLGIFDISGRTMNLIIANPGEPRPSKFIGKPEAMLFHVSAPTSSP